VKSCNTGATFLLLNCQVFQMGSCYHSALFHQSHFSYNVVFHIHFSNISVSCSHSSFFSNIAESSYIAQIVVPVMSFSLTVYYYPAEYTSTKCDACSLASFKYISGKYNSVSVSVWGISI
jgi:hypothetical protein